MKIFTSKTVQMTDSIGEYLPVSETAYEYSGPLALADRSQVAAGKAATANENATASTYGGQASGIESQLIPGLEKEAAHPTGYNPTDVNNMEVASQQGAGGTNSAIQGQAGLQGTRTRNTANMGGILDEAARDKGRANSSNALDVQNANANLKQQQQQFAQEQLGSAAGKDTQAQLSAMGMVPESINSTLNADKTGWFQNLTGFMSALGQDASGAGKLIHG